MKVVLVAVTTTVIDGRGDDVSSAILMAEGFWASTDDYEYTI